MLTSLACVLLRGEFFYVVSVFVFHLNPIRFFSCRAFSDLPDFYRYAARLCNDEGRMLAMKGVYPMTEVECLEDKSVIEDVVALKVPGLDAERHLVIMHPAVQN